MPEKKVEIISPSEEKIRELALSQLSEALSGLDLAAVRSAVEQHRTKTRESCSIDVVPSDDGRLTFIIDCRLFTVEILVSAESFDDAVVARKHLEKCLGIIDAMQEAAVTAVGEHARCPPFAFWNSEDDDDAERWKALRSIWA